ncbi:Late embryogenesis abundant protein, LEA-14 [Artemisia annua]|uniref:Late embryogenesis abundant protein, LEA-14 n=1 Tax=Artemisia annua TaxID=35608 RepID=A0A2U1QMU8_ARTAN|nr:Late embryogenesis abundant protein, LEA-14 [Artemisia annua]
MMHEKSEIDDSSLGDSISPSSSSPKHGYYVQSPSRDSHDDKSSTNSHSTPIESPSHSSHSRMSASSRISGPYRPYKFQVHMQSWKVNNFYYGEGSDNTGVSTKLLTINCTVKMNIHNPATFFGIHVSSTSLNLLYSRIVVGRGQFLNYYQPKKSQRTMLVNVEGRQVPLYGAGWGLVMSNSNGRFPVNLAIEIHSQANLVGWYIFQQKQQKLRMLEDFRCFNTLKLKTRTIRVHEDIIRIAHNLEGRATGVNSKTKSTLK